MIQQDFYGHGYSACPPNLEYTIPVFVEQTEEIMDKLSVLKEYTNILIIGHSMGGILYTISMLTSGLVGSHFAARNKNKVSKVVLLNAAGIPVNFSFAK